MARITARIGIVTVGALLASLLASGTVSAAAPIISKVQSWTLVIPAGVNCDFAVEWDVTAGNTTNQIVFERSNGDILIRQAGRQLVTVTNLDTEESITLRGGFRTDFLLHPDGTADFTLAGTVLVGFFPTDVGGPGQLFIRGLARITGDADFNFFSFDLSGRSTDVCAALSA